MLNFHKPESKTTYFFLKCQVTYESKGLISFDKIATENITQSEIKALLAIVNNDHYNGVNWAVYSKGVNPFANKKTFSGVLSSLVKKGYAGTSFEDSSDCCWITEAGLNALNNLSK